MYPTHWTRLTKTALVVAFIVAAFGGLANAALPPDVQTAKDLDVLVAFVKKYPVVAIRLKSIDMQTYSVRFDADCKAEFVRRVIERPLGYVGPAEPLVFSRSNCKLE